MKSRADFDSIFRFIIDDNEVLIDDITDSYGKIIAQDDGEKPSWRCAPAERNSYPSGADQVLAEQEIHNRKIGEVVLEKGLASSRDIEQALRIQEHSRKDAESSTVRVDTAKLDALMNLLGEIVIGQSSLARIANRMDDENGAALRNSLYGLDRVTREFQEQIMRIRMIPVGPLFSQFNVLCAIRQGNMQGYRSGY
jgi:two-component system chemotaxis sensor kinase CheA